jgi:hypothetical protein
MSEFARHRHLCAAQIPKGFALATKLCFVAHLGGMLRIPGGGVRGSALMRPNSIVDSRKR